MTDPYGGRISESNKLYFFKKQRDVEPSLKKPVEQKETTFIVPISEKFTSKKNVMYEHLKENVGLQTLDDYKKKKESWLIIILRTMMIKKRERKGD